MTNSEKNIVEYLDKRISALTSMLVNYPHSTFVEQATKDRKKAEKRREKILKKYDLI